MTIYKCHTLDLNLYLALVYKCTMCTANIIEIRTSIALKLKNWHQKRDSK